MRYHDYELTKQSFDLEWWSLNRFEPVNKQTLDLLLMQAQFEKLSVPSFEVKHEAYVIRWDLEAGQFLLGAEGSVGESVLDDAERLRICKQKFGLGSLMRAGIQALRKVAAPDPNGVRRLTSAEPWFPSQASGIAGVKMMLNQMREKQAGKV